jgi:hypothetical protein
MEEEEGGKMGMEGRMKGGEGRDGRRHKTALLLDMRMRRGPCYADDYGNFRGKRGEGRMRMRMMNGSKKRGKSPKLVLKWRAKWPNG